MCQSGERRGTVVNPFQGKSGRGERIRTSGLYVPNVALYQAKLHPEVTGWRTRATSARRACGQDERLTAKVVNCSRDCLCGESARSASADAARSASAEATWRE